MQAVAAMVEAAKRGQWRVMIGDNENLFDMTYVENVAYAHWLALDQLVSNPSVNGQVTLNLITLDPRRICSDDVCIHRHSQSQMINPCFSGIL